MTIYSTATLAYHATVQAPQTLAKLAAALAAVELDTAVLDEYGVSVQSDNTTSGGSTATRTIVVSLAPTFVGRPLVATEPGGYIGAIVSSDPTDTMDVLIHYTDQSDNPGVETVKLNGTTPVPLRADGKKSITSPLQPASTPAGQLSVFQSCGINPVLQDDGSIVNTPTCVLGDLVGILAKNTHGSVVCSSDNDSASGVGARTLTISYASADASTHTESVTLNGKTPVALPNANLSKITDVAVATAGDLGGNAGQISFWSGPNATGACLGTLPVSFHRLYPSTTDQKAPFVGIFLQQLAAGIASHMTADPPVLM